MEVGDVIRHNGIKYTVTCFYAPYVDENQIEQIKVVDELNKIISYDRIKVTAVNERFVPKVYVHIPIENVTLLNGHKPLWKHEPIPLWLESDLVPNPK